MADEKAPGDISECPFRLLLTDIDWCQCNFSEAARNGSFSLLGFVWSDAKHLQGRRAVLTIMQGHWRTASTDIARRAGREPEIEDGEIGALTSTRTMLRHDGERGVESIESREPEEEEEEEEDFRVIIYLDQSAFDAALRHCRDALSDRRHVSATLNLVSAAFGPRRAFIDADDFDYPAGFRAAILNLHLSSSMVWPRWSAQRPIRVPDAPNSSSRWTTERIRVTEITISWSMPRASLSTFKLEGTTGGYGSKIGTIGASVEFMEYEKEGRGRYPLEAFQGDFRWMRDKEVSHLYVQLRYRESDLIGALKPLLEGRGHDGISLTVSLSANSENVKASDKDVSGDVLGWEIRTGTSFVPPERR